MNDIITTIVFDTQTADGYPLQFRWNGSLTINVFTAGGRGGDRRDDSQRIQHGECSPRGGGVAGRRLQRHSPMK
jgi:hypothetical protein